MSASITTNPFVFISYARADGEDESTQIYEALRQERFSVWRDQRNIKPYQDFSVAIERAIRKSSHVLVCLTPSIAERDDSFVRREIIYAQNQKRPIIPLLFEGFLTKDIPVLISHLTYINFAHFAEGFNSLLEHLRRKDVDYEPPVLPDDPFRHHIEQLNGYMVDELEQMVSRSKIILLHSQDEPSAVERILPVAYRVRKMHFFQATEERQHFDNFHEAFAHYDQRMLLLGEPGSGKTTTLYAFAREKANERLADPNALVPIYAPIRTWDGNQSLIDWISSVAGLDSTKVRTEIDSERALLLLDGLDEVLPDAETPSASYEKRAKFVRQLAEFGNTPLLITSRVKDYDEIVVSTGKRLKLNGAAILKPLSVEQVRTYLEDYPQLLKALQSDKDLLEMARNPLLLTLLTVAFQGESMQMELLSNINSSRAEWRDTIFSSYVQRRYEFEKFRSDNLPFSLSEIYETLGQAAANLVGNKIPSGSNKLDTALFEDLLSARAQLFVEFAQRLHYLRSMEPNIFRFIHLLLRDHFAIRYLQPRIRSDNPRVRQTAQRILRRLNTSTVNVFLSYGMESALSAEIVRDILLRYGISIFSPNSWLDEYHVRANEDWEDEIRRAIQRSDFFIFLLNNAAKDSPSIQEEVSFARNQNITIIPILLEEMELPPWLSDIEYNKVSFRQDKQRLANELVPRIIGVERSASGSQIFLRNLLRRYERFSSSSIALSVQMTQSRLGSSSVSLLTPQNLERNYSHPWRLLLLGQPGSGKTTALQRLLVAFARRALRDPFARIPVWVTVNEFTLTSSLDLDRIIDDTVKHQQLGSYSLEQLIILADGINELLPEQRDMLVTWIEYHPETSIILSSRPHGISDWAADFKVIELLPPSEMQVRDLISQNYPPGEAETFWEWLKSSPEMLKISRSPLTLKLLLSTFAGVTDLRSISVDAIFDTLISRSLADVEAIVSQEQLSRFLHLIATEMKTTNDVVTRDQLIALSKSLPGNERALPEDLIRAAIRSGIITEMPNGFAFTHDSFWAHFAQD